MPAGGDLGDGRRRVRSLDLRARGGRGRQGARNRGGRPTRSRCDEGRVSTCSPSAELGDISGWSPMLGIFSSSSVPAPILPFARAGRTCASESRQGSQSYYFSARSKSDAEAEAGVGTTTATCSPNSTSTSPRELSTAVAVSSTQGTDCSKVSVPLGRGIRCGFDGWGWLYQWWWRLRLRWW